MRAHSQEQMSSQQGGVSTGGVHTPVHDAEHRPITAGGFVDHGPVVFKDISERPPASPPGVTPEELPPKPTSLNRWEVA